MREEEKTGNQILIIGCDTLKIPMIAEAAKKRAEIENEKEVERKKEEIGFPVFQQPEGIIHFEAIKGLYIPDGKSSQRRRYNRRKRY